MKYENLVQEMYARFPQLEKKAKNEGLDNYYDETMPHIAFGMVFAPVLIDAVENDPAKASAMFEMLDEMENAETEIAEVCEFSVLENVADELADEKVVPYLRTEALFSAWTYIRRYILG